mmetsp:Transcript_11225/g.27604  ORF Transcript_11225/g.27604 Transcript_11225/m.27604 type:complete len:180 (+) Transcript_11225:108-647(+)|eukprot:CAMPEP_0114489448 /NCGR_PEP_ID=MMETSP0109-20121206/1897_1 /TAXON_ID=29199 /ORGANISM="Chlorarachnion reptans, Strain CCCM449" /LENGTH=179 /DNA_ID=CAMNT_0001665965 /DNA_START=106 /DNA_END=645 /DNA_ORIENTATION=+
MNGEKHSSSNPKLRGHEDLISYFNLHGHVKKLTQSKKRKPMRTTFYRYVKGLPGPAVIDKGSSKDGKQATIDLSVPEFDPPPLVSILKDDIWNDNEVWDVAKSSRDDGDRKLDSTLSKYLYPPKPPGRLEKLSRRTAKGAFCEEMEPAPLQLFKDGIPRQQAGEKSKKKKDRNKRKGPP